MSDRRHASAAMTNWRLVDRIVRLRRLGPYGAVISCTRCGARSASGAMAYLVLRGGFQTVWLVCQECADELASVAVG